MKMHSLNDIVCVMFEHISINLYLKYALYLICSNYVHIFNMQTYLYYNIYIYYNTIIYIIYRYSIE